MYYPLSLRLRAMYALAPARVYLVNEERATLRVAISTKSLADVPAYRQLREAGGKVASGIGHVARESGFREHWRAFVLLVAFSFVGAGVAARALIAGFEDTWTDTALVSAQQENQALRERQEELRKQTEAALAQLQAMETTTVSYARTP